MIALRPVVDVAAELGVAPEHVLPWGRHRAKLDLATLEGRSRQGKLVLLSAISPTQRGEGKTTVSVALAMSMRRLGRRVALCLREPSVGPVFGVKGGGTGGGAAQVEPAEDINLHFTGDLHAIASAHNLLAALVDNDLHFGAKTGLDVRRVTFPRVLDMNDRALRHVVIGLGGRLDGVPRESRFDITAASEIMACLGLARSLEDLRTRLERVIVGTRIDGSVVTARELGAVDAMLALLRHALMPNLVQTREGGPALVHAGPFANIAHGCSSVLATELGLRHAEVVVTEAGFGFDLGGEKFLHLKARANELVPHAVLLVATVRGLRAHGQGELARGMEHLDRQLDNVARFGLTPVIAINVFADDEADALAAVEAHASARGVRVARCEGFARGGDGALELAQVVSDAIAGAPPAPRFLYEPEAPLREKIRSIARELYGAREVSFAAPAERDLEEATRQGYGHLPVCIAKTPLSFSDDPRAGGLVRDHVVTVTSARVSAGAGFVVALMGDVSTMPGLPHDPAAQRVRVDTDGTIHGLMQGS